MKKKKSFLLFVVNYALRQFKYFIWGWRIYGVVNLHSQIFPFILEAENKSIQSNLTKDTFKAAPQKPHPSSGKQDTGILAELELWHQASVAASNSTLFWRTFVEMAWLIHQGTWLCRVYAWQGELNYRACWRDHPSTVHLKVWQL